MIVSLYDQVMGLALDEALKASQRGEVPVGAAVLFEGEIVHRATTAEFRADRATAHALLGVA